MENGLLRNTGNRPSNPLIRETEDNNKERSGGGTEWEDPYANAIDNKLTALRMQNSPVLEVGSEGGGSAVELNKLSHLLAKW